MLKVYGVHPAKKELKGITRDIRVMWVLEELNLKYEYILLDPSKGENKTPEYLKLNPTGKIPTLIDGEFSIFESAAICSYLCHKEMKLLPKNESSDYWIHQQWIFYVLTNIEPHTGRVFGCDHLFEQNEKTAFARKLATDILARMLSPLNERLGQKQYLMGDEFQLVDLLLVTSLFYVRNTDILKNYSDLKRYLKDCGGRPALGLLEGRS